MVDPSMRRRKHPKTRLTLLPTGKPCLTALPDEVKLALLNSGVFTTHDICNLRASCRSMVPACNTHLQDTHKILYIHPSRTALRRMIQVCEHAFFSQKIEEVVLLGRACRNRANGGVSVAVWPKRAPRFSLPLFSGETHAIHVPLVKALQRLPSLRRLSLARAVNGPGFNSISAAQIENYAGSKIPSLVEQCSDVAVVVAMLEHLPCITSIAMSDAQHANTVLEDVTENGKSRDQRRPSSRALGSLTHLQIPIATTSLPSNLIDWSSWVRPSLVSLDLTFSIQTWRRIATNDARAFIWSKNLCDLLANLKLPNMREFTLKQSVCSKEPQRRYTNMTRANDVPDWAESRLTSKVKRSNKHIADWSRPPRPVSLFDMDCEVYNFFVRHAPSLKVVRIFNVLFYEDILSSDEVYVQPLANGLAPNPKQTEKIIRLLRPHRHPEIDACDTSKSYKSYLGVENGQIDFSWEISRFVHHAFCREHTAKNESEDEVGRTGRGLRDGNYASSSHAMCKMECGQYNVYANVDDFEQLAARYYVPLDEKKQVWDFAKMKMVENRELT